MKFERVSRKPSALVPVNAAEHPVSIGGVFGWLRMSDSRRGVVFCGTHGYEQLCAHRGWRELAHRVAESGCTTLRLDYPGQGDSREPDGAVLADWIGSIRRAIAYLREAAAVDEVVLVGLRLGGTLAALASEEESVERLVLLAPFTTGRAYLREMKLQSKAINLLPDGRPMPAEPGPLNIGGFRLDPGLVSDLSLVDLLVSSRGSAPHVLVMGGDGGAFAARLAARGSTVETAPFPDLGGLVGVPQNSSFTEETASTIAAYAASGARGRTGSLPLPVPAAAAIEGAFWREQAVRVGQGAFGIECRPIEPDPARARVLILNTGPIVRSGHGRQATALARRLAGQGIVSLRVDLLGVGDSPARPDGSSPLYNLDAVEDVRAAIDYLAHPDGAGVVVQGTCNGAYLAFHALCRDERIGSAILANLYCFDWALTHGAEPVSTRPLRSATAYAELLRRRGAVRRLLKRRTPVASILLRMARRKFHDMVAALRAGGRREPIAKRIAKLRQRGAQPILLYSAGDLGLADLRLQLGSTPAEIARVLGEPARILADADHNLSTEAAQEVLFGTLMEAVARVDGAIKPNSARDASRLAAMPSDTGSSVIRRDGQARFTIEGV